MMSRDPHADDPILAELIENIPAAVAYVDAEELRYRVVNGRLCDFLGKPRGEILGKKVRELVGGENFRQVEPFIAQVIRGERVHFESLLQNKEGERWYQIDYVPRHDAGGRLTGYFVHSQDVDDRKRLEISVQRSEDSYQTLIETLSEGIALNEMVFDGTGAMVDYRVLQVNPMFHKVADFHGADPVGRLATDLYGMSREMIVDFWKAHRVKTATAFAEMKSPRSGKWFSIATSPFHDGKFVTTFFDITEQKKTEEALQRAEKLESLGLLAGGIAHDFNNLLTGIFGQLELARARCREEAVSEPLARAMEVFDRARNLASQLLTFSKGGAPVLKPGALGPVVRRCLRFATSGSAVAVTEDIPADLPWCLFDENQFAQVVDNLVLNALQAMPHGGVLTVFAEACEVPRESGHPFLKPGPYVRLTIRDLGGGIPPDVLGKVMDPFFTTKPGGSGLGLSTAFSIMKKHGGHLEIESELGRGTAVRLWLPACEPAPERSASPGGSEAERGRGRILLMDDQDYLRELARVQLEGLGYEVCVVANGQEALSRIEEAETAGQPYDAVLLDLTVVGGMGGKETCGELRKTRPSLPIFVVSGYGEDEAMARPSQFGFTESLLKPYRIGDLVALLKKHLPR